jgi:AcrR family transcriptional regulator
VNSRKSLPVSRARIIESALATAIGPSLKAISIASLAADAGKSKSTFFAHFQNKEKVQLAVPRVDKRALSLAGGETG